MCVTVKEKQHFVKREKTLNISTVPIGISKVTLLGSMGITLAFILKLSFSLQSQQNRTDVDRWWGGGSMATLSELVRAGFHTARRQTNRARTNEALPSSPVGALHQESPQRKGKKANCERETSWLHNFASLIRSRF